MRALLLIAGLACVTGQQVRDQRTEPPSGTATITGVVTVATDSRPVPLRRAKMVLVRDGRQVAITATDADGRYRFESIAAGRYRVEMEKAGFVRTSAVTDYELTRDEHLTIDVAALRGGALEGRFVDERGVPIERLTVTAERIPGSEDAGRPSTHSAMTDDLGRFRVHTIPPGRYHLRAQPPAPGEALFYPGTANPAEAAILTVSAGQTIDRLDVTVPAAPLSPAASEAIASVEREIAAAEATGSLGRIIGRVTRSDIAAPVANAEIRLSTSTGVLVRTAISDGDGAFAFGAIPAGRYSVAATALGFITPGASVSSATRGTPITVVEGTRTEKADVTLTPASAVEVRVLDEFGEPAPGIVLRIARRIIASNAASPRELAPASNDHTGVTDDRGWFRACRLPADEYYVMALPEPFSRSGPAVFAVTYFPGTSSASAASPIRLTAGLDVHNISFSLVPTTTSTVSGVVVGTDGQRRPGTRVLLLAHDGGQIEGAPRAPLSQSVADAQGTFTFRDVPEGTYMLQGSADGWLGNQRLTIGPASTKTPVQTVLTLAALGSASGRVIFDGGPPESNVAQMMSVYIVPSVISFRPIGTEFINTIRGGALAAPEWTFRLRNIPYSGIISVSFPPSSPWVFSRVLLQGRDITDTPYDFHTGDVTGLEVVVTNRVGTLSGTVTDSANQFSDVDIIAFGADDPAPNLGSRFTRLTRADAKGVFRIAKMLPGRYLVVAIGANGAPMALTNPELMRAKGTPATVIEGTNATVSLTVIR